MASKKLQSVPRDFLAGHVVNVRWDKDREAIEFTIGQQKFCVSSQDEHKNQVRFATHVLVVFEPMNDGLKKIVKVIKNPTPTQIVHVSRGCLGKG